MKQKIKILFVDDDYRQSRLYIESLRDEGFDVYVIDNTDEALREISSAQYEIIVLDLLMDPGLAFSQEESAAGNITGWLLARQARRIKPNSLVVILTAARDPEVSDWCAKQEPPVLFYHKAAVLYDDFAASIKKTLAKTYQPDVEEIMAILKRFHKVAKQLTRRHENRGAYTIQDEYDVQDLLHALLKSRFDDIRSEEWTPSSGGGAARMDLLIKGSSIVVEVKKTRPSLSATKLGEQLIVDVAKYKSHPSCKNLICFIYDPDGLLENPGGLKSDIEQLSSPALQVFVEVSPSAP